MDVKKRVTTDTVEILYDRFIKGDPEQERLYREELCQLRLGVEVRRLRLDANLTEEELAEKLGVRPSEIEMIEAGEYPNPSVQLLEKIAACFNKRVTVTFEDIPVPPTSLVLH